MDTTRGSLPFEALSLDGAPSARSEPYLESIAAPEVQSPHTSAAGDGAHLRPVVTLESPDLGEDSSVSGEESEDSDAGGSDGSLEEDVGGEAAVVDDMLSSSLAEVNSVEVSEMAALPAPLSLPPASYPHHNLPPRTGISVPTWSKAPNWIRSIPKEPELLYVPPDTLFDDIVRQETDRISRPEDVKNHIVYDSVDPNPEHSAGEPPAHEGSDADGELPPYYVLSGPDDTTLVFESRFESGNLRRAIQVYDFEYDLVLNPDYNTKSHTQWFLFRVGNTRKDQCYKFNILNMVKPSSVYKDGMRPLQYSTIEAKAHSIGWVRCGDSIAYYQNGLRRKDNHSQNYYTLTFTVACDHDFDKVYFSHCYPYSYTDLQNDLAKLEQDPHMSRRFRRRKLCETLAGNACDLITITSFGSEPEALRARRAVVITARVHPGESNASWVMKGILDYLTNASLDARILRDNFVFKIVPMLNPDGVIVGNYRCSLAGQDLNRLWDDPSRKMHPTIFFTKSMIRHLLNDREVVLFVDIHGHSRKRNVFMYGNSGPGSGSGLAEKIFPGLLCRNSDVFQLDDCCFKVQKCKESTARVVAYHELSITNAYTLEASFCGADFGPLADQHFTMQHLEEMGYMLCDAILDFCDPDQTRVFQVVRELQMLYSYDGSSDDVSDSEDDAASRNRRKGKGKPFKRRKKKAASSAAVREDEREATEVGSTSRAAAVASTSSPWKTSSSRDTGGATGGGGSFSQRIRQAVDDDDKNVFRGAAASRLSAAGMESSVGALDGGGKKQRGEPSRSPVRSKKKPSKERVPASSTTQPGGGSGRGASEARASNAVFPPLSTMRARSKS